VAVGGFCGEARAGGRLIFYQGVPGSAAEGVRWWWRGDLTPAGWVWGRGGSGDGPGCGDGGQGRGDGQGVPEGNAEGRHRFEKG